jgi:Zn-dependent peptidase ImmA (M78 family)
LDPEHYAIGILKNLGIHTLPVDPFRIAKEFDIEIIEVDADEIDGCLLRYGQNTRILINKNIGSIGRKNFTVSHEIGHFILPEHRGVNYRCSARYLNPIGANPKIEVEANRFASELLLPESLLKPLIHQFKPDFDDINDLAVFCNASLTAATIKYVSLTSERCALVVSSNNLIKWNKRSTSFNCYIQNGAPIAKGSLTASYMHTGVPQIIASQKTPARFWVEGKGIGGNTELIECCIPIPKYGDVLTILWFVDLYINEEDTEEEEEYRYEESTWKWRDPAD